MVAKRAMDCGYTTLPFESIGGTYLAGLVVAALVHVSRRAIGDGIAFWVARAGVGFRWRCVVVGLQV